MQAFFARLLVKLQTAILKYIAQYGIRAIWDFLCDLVRKAQRKAIQDKELEKLEEINKDPNSTVEERAKQYEDTINSGR
jgi:hypothetical protein